METTPPPARRLRTPPTPLHGARYDTYEPYSPRRSSRVAAQRKQYSQQLHASDTTPPKSQHRSPRVVRATTPTTTSSVRHTLTSASSQTFSPPPSPHSPITRSIGKSPRTGSGRYASNGLKKRFQGEAAAVDSDSDNIATSSTREYLSTMDPRAMLPTPAKTPRKRNVHSDMSSTARVLFQDRPATIEDAMPDPRKSRKAKKYTAFTLQSFMEADEDAETEKIEIYTDSKERIPILDEEEDNPFITSKKNGKAKTRSTRESKRRKIDEKTAEMEEAAENDEGMIYVFRGRKIFRKFDNGALSAASSDVLHLSEDDTRRKAGADVHRPFTRSTIKPRLLFPNEEQRQERLERELAEEEEAVTDIEFPISASRKTRKGDQIQTPVKQHFTPATPPSTGRAHRGKKAVEADNAMEIDEEEAETPRIIVHEDEEAQTPPAPKTRGKKTSPFDSWQRVKSSSRVHAGKGTKREGESLEKAGEGKRTRSGAHATAGSSTDV